MKKLFPLLIAGLLFISCSGFFQDPAPVALTGDVSFAVSRSALKSAISRTEETYYDTTAFVVSLAGGYNATQSYIISENDTEVPESDEDFIKFTNVPVGASIYVEAKLFSYNQDPTSSTPPDFSQMTPDAYGRSSPVVVTEGINYISLKLFNFYGAFPFVITINFDGVSASDIESFVEDLYVYAVPNESSFGRSIISAGTDSVKIYEELSGELDGDVMGIELTNSGGYSNYTISGNSVIVTSNFYLPIDFSAPAEKGRESFLMVAKRTANAITTQQTYKTKYFGKSDSFIPYKTTTNTASFTVSKMNLIDTPVVTYQNSVNGMSFTLDSTSSVNSNTYYADFCFDAESNFYTVKNNGGDTYLILSNRSDYNNTATFDVSSFGGYSPHLIVDLKTNIMYAYVCNERRLYITKYPLFISSGSTASSTSYALLPDFATVDGNNGIENYPGNCVIYNGTVYIIANDTSDTYGAFLYKASLNELSGRDNDNAPYDNIPDHTIPDGKRLNLPYGSVTDLYYEDGYLYMLVAQYVLPSYLATSTPVYSRGLLAKYDPATDTFVETIGGTTTGTPTNNGKLYLYQDYYPNLDHFLYRDDAFSIPYLVDKDFSEFMFGNAANVFPDFYIPSDSQKAFRNPTKIIAIKPKKLVIADDGIAFYTDNDAWNYKNSDRIITVDLEHFVIENIDTTTSPFEKTEDSDLYSQNDVISSTNFGVSYSNPVYQNGYSYSPDPARDMKVAIKFKQN